MASPVPGTPGTPGVPSTPMSPMSPDTPGRDRSSSHTSDPAYLLARVKLLGEQLSEAKLDRDTLVNSLRKLFDEEYRKYCSTGGGKLVVKVVEARELEKMDKFGQSDPYCVLTIEGDTQKTDVVKKTLEPKWDAEFKFPLDSDTAELVIDMFDWDKIGDDEFMGRVTIPVSSLLDGQWHDQWLNLRPKQEGGKETKGYLHVVAQFQRSAQSVLAAPAPSTPMKRGTSGVVARQKAEDALERAEMVKRILVSKVENVEVEVSKGFEERDRILKDLDTLFSSDFEKYCGQSSIGQLVVTVIEAKNLKKMDTFGASDPYVMVNVEGSEAKTEVIMKTLTPKWNATFTFSVGSAGSDLLLTLYDFDKVGAHEVMGVVRLPLSVVINAKETGIDKWVALEGRKAGDKVKGELHFKALFSPKAPSQEGEAKPSTEADVVVHKIKSVRSVVMERVENVDKIVDKLTMDLGNIVEEVKALFQDEYYKYCAPKEIGKVQVHVIEARDLEKMDLIGSSDPYCVVKIGREVQKTEVKNKTVQPKWNAQFTMSVSHASEDINLEVFDWDKLGKHDFMGCLSVPIAELLSGQQEDKWIPLSGKKGVKEKVKGEVHVGFKYVPKDAAVPPAEEGASAASQAKNAAIRQAKQVKTALLDIVTNAEVLIEAERKEKMATVHSVKDLFESHYYKYCRPDELGRLQVVVIEAKDLPKMDIGLTGGTCDPYAQLTFEGQQEKTDVCKKTLAPKWNKEMTFSVGNVESNLVVSIFDWDQVGDHDHVGDVTLPLKDFLSGDSVDRWFKLQPKGKKKEVKGDIHLALRYVAKDAKEKGDTSAAPTTGAPETPATPEVSETAHLVSDAPTPSATVQPPKEEAKVVTKDEALMMAKGVRDALLGKVEGAEKLVRQVQDMFATEYFRFVKPRSYLNVTVFAARNLVAKDWLSGASDPYCILTCEDQEFKTEIKEKTLNPEWNAYFSFVISDPSTAELRVVLYDYDKIGSHDFLGEVTVPLSFLEEDVPAENWYPLRKRKARHKVKGDVHLELEYSFTRKMPGKAEPIPETSLSSEEVLDRVSHVKEQIATQLKELEAKVARMEEAVSTAGMKASDDAGARTRAEVEMKEVQDRLKKEREKSTNKENELREEMDEAVQRAKYETEMELRKKYVFIPKLSGGKEKKQS
eukprot:TRINITY_DN21846_c0_g1_i1.p1 TRINITY_DN21846_c0_g1~~TRINITY_DN21846_c0_g1_i1.p1  ORF type:complete len:1314 (+),score=387.07 TRINITY_DN21846_c0_g1_i1:460-3942(+)